VIRVYPAGAQQHGDAGAGDRKAAPHEINCLVERRIGDHQVDRLGRRQHVRSLPDERADDVAAAAVGHVAANHAVGVFLQHVGHVVEARRRLPDALAMAASETDQDCRSPHGATASWIRRRKASCDVLQPAPLGADLQRCHDRTFGRSGFRHAAASTKGIFSANMQPWGNACCFCRSSLRSCWPRFS
jgi:hypothetical protein